MQIWICLTTRKKKTIAVFYRFMDLFKSGTGQSTCKDEPTAIEFTNFATNKLANLNQPDLNKIKQMVV